MKIVFVLMMLFAMSATAQSVKRGENDASQSLKMVPPKPKVTQETMGSLSCEEQKRAYRESVACFDRYRRPDGTLAPNAFRACQELKQPRC